MRETQLVISADLLHDLPNLPLQFGLHSQDQTLHLSVEHDGKGGLIVKATNDALDRKVSHKEETSTDVNTDGTEVKTVKEKKNIWPWILVGVSITLLAVIGLYIVFKRHLNNH